MRICVNLGINTLKKGVVVGARVDTDTKAKLGELANGNGENINQLLGRLIDQYIQGGERTIVVTSKEQESTERPVKKTDKHPANFPCPLCDAPLEYHKSLLSDEIKCSNPDCDTHDEKGLRSTMGERAYIHSLNVKRREHNAIVPKTPKKDALDGLFEDLIG